MADLAKRMRRGLKEPAQSALAWAAVRGLDTRPREVDDIRRLAPGAIVVSRTDRIGDMLVSSVMIAALHRRWPDARLVVIPGPGNRAALEGLPFVEAGPSYSRSPGKWHALRTWLRAQHFDLAMSLQAESMAGVLIAAASRAPVRMVTHATKTAPAFNVVLGPGERHHVTRFCRAAAQLGAPCADMRPVFEVPAVVRAGMAGVGRAWREGGRPVVGLQIPNRSSRRHAARAWPADQVLGFVATQTLAGHRVVLFAFGPELAEAEAVRAAVPAAVLAPPVALASAAALLEHVDVFVSGYTGTYHLADAVGVATVLIGSAHYAEYWRALGPRHRHVLGESAADVPTGAVVAAVAECLEERAGS